MDSTAKFPGIRIGNSIICSDIWHKYNERYFEIVIRNFTSLSDEELFRYTVASNNESG